MIYLDRLDVAIFRFSVGLPSKERTRQWAWRLGTGDQIRADQDERQVGYGQPPRCFQSFTHLLLALFLDVKTAMFQRQQNHFEDVFLWNECSTKCCCHARCPCHHSSLLLNYRTVNSVKPRWNPIRSICWCLNYTLFLQIPQFSFMSIHVPFFPASFWGVFPV